MTISIPDSFWDKYNDVAENIFLGDNHFSRVCTLYYPPKQETCTECNTAWLGGTSKNVFQHGGPAPMTNSECTNCAGNGYREKEVTDTLRLRVYWNKRDWVKTSVIVTGDSIAQIIGKIADLPKLMNANEIQLVSEQKEKEIRVKLSSEPFYHGFGKNRFFIAFVKQC